MYPHRTGAAIGGAGRRRGFQLLLALPTMAITLLLLLLLLLLEPVAAAAAQQPEPPQVTRERPQAQQQEQPAVPVVASMSDMDPPVNSIEV